MTNVLMNIHIVYTQNVMISCTFTCSPEEHNQPLASTNSYGNCTPWFLKVVCGNFSIASCFWIIIIFGTAILNWLSNTSSKY